METVIEIKDLVKKYGENEAVKGISFEIKRGEVVGFLGPNGAGKSTTMNILTGYLSSTSGEVKVCGYSILENPNEVKKRIGYLPEQPPLYFDMTVYEYLSFVYDLKGVKEDKQAHITEVMEIVDIEKVSGRLIKNLSKGYKQRVGLAQALIGSPEVLILDEPTVGLDPGQIIEIRSVIKKLGEKRTIILSTHILQEVAAICDRVIIINNGQIAAMDTLENLSGAGTGEYLIRARSSFSKIKDIFAGMGRIENMGHAESGTVDVKITTDTVADKRAQIINTLVSNGVDVLMFRPVEHTLEEVFIKATGSAETEASE
ncbi:MAG: ATP-binding cassette domain-containing protein [Clostridia bacterium]|nr:ATP-binding cassette domain-containing protein [Clostridia bacterium]